MTALPFAPRLIDAMSREVASVRDSSGTITGADGRAESLLSAHPGHWVLEGNLPRKLKKAPRLLLLDLVLQDMTAFDVLDEPKADPRNVPVILQTCHEAAIARIHDALSKAGLGARVEERKVHRG